MLEQRDKFNKATKFSPWCPVSAVTYSEYYEAIWTLLINSAIKTVSIERASDSVTQYRRVSA